MEEKFIWPLMENSIQEEEIQALLRFLASNQRFTKGEKSKEFEEKWSEWQGCKYSVFVNSGSSANLIMLDALKELYGWKNGDKIVVPAVTWSTNISPILQLGLEPVFVDINLENISFDLEKLEKVLRVEKDIVAVFVTHLLGFPAEVDKIKRLCKDSNIKLVEDCCEATGATKNNIKIGNFGECGSFSFYFGHHMTTIEGGMVCTNNRPLHNILLLKRSHGLARELSPEYFEIEKAKNPHIDPLFLFSTTGYNVRNHEIPAIIGLEQLKKLDNIIEKRNNNFNLYQKIIRNHSDKLFIHSSEGVSSFSLPFIFKEKQDLEKFKQLLKKEKIEFRPILGGNMLNQPFLENYKHYLENTPNATLVHKQGIYIGNNQFIKEENINRLDNLLNKLN
jgi:CDP-4-dehydro-6-deoxyglucose reductase, E1